MIELDNKTTTTKRTLNEIKKALKCNLETKYNIKDEEIVNSMLKIHGLYTDNFDFVSNIEEVIKEKINYISIDDNSNKDEKTVEGIVSEVVAPVKKAVGFDYLYKSMKELYGKQEAKRLIGEMMDLSLGLADSTNILKPYCYALDASKIVTLGRDFGILHSKGSKHVSSYVSALCETIHQMSSHLAGAIAIGTFFLDITHILLMKEKISLSEFIESKELRKNLENEYQQFIHSVNHLSRNGIESPFSNISVFDRAKLKTLVKDYIWYYTDMEENDVNEKIKKDSKKFIKDNTNGTSPTWEDYVIEYIIETQNLFLDLFDKGDPTKDGIPYRFPVVTLNLSKKKWGDKWVIEDNEFFKDICKREIYRYNIFSSEGTKVASCCRLINDTEMMELASQSNSFGGASVSLGSHRVVTINFVRIALECKNRGDFYKLFEERLYSAGKILKAHKHLLLLLKEKGLQQFLSNGWITMNRLFSTFGILGIYEGVEIFKKRFSIAKEIDVTKDWLIFMNDTIKEISKEYEIISNIEQIPAESFAKRLVKSDKLIYGEDKIPYKLYANQFVPLWHDVSIWEKFEIDGRYNALISGGGIVHGSIGEKTTSFQNAKLIRHAVDSGCEHFALNMIYAECENGHVSKGRIQTCPVCGGSIIDYMTRVVGFFVRVSNFNKVRKEWEFPRRHIHTKEEIENEKIGENFKEKNVVNIVKSC